MDMDRAKALKLLGLDNSASDQDIKSAYLKLAKEFHPDVNKSPGAEEQFKKIGQAYKYLKDNNGGGWGFSGSIFDFIKTQEKARDAQKEAQNKKEESPEPPQPQVPAKHEGFSLEDALDVFRTVAQEAGERLGNAADRVSDILLTQGTQDGARNAVNGLDALLSKKFGINMLNGAGDKVAGALYSAGKTLKKRGPGNDPGQGPKP